MLIRKGTNNNEEKPDYQLGKLFQFRYVTRMRNNLAIDTSAINVLRTYKLDIFSFHFHKVP